MYNARNVPKEVAIMQKTIQDLFTQEEWEMFSKNFVPQLLDIADLTLPEGMDGEEAEHE